MSAPTSLIMVQFLAWIAECPRSYAETMEAWRTSCPRLSVWEDATSDGLVRRRPGPGGCTLVRLTARGRSALADATPPAERRSSKFNLNRVREGA